MRRCAHFLLFLLVLTTTAFAQPYEKEWDALFNGDVVAGPEDASAVAVDSGGNVYVTGTSSEDIYTVCYSPTGSFKWKQKYDNGLVDEAFDILVDFTGTIWVAGASQGAGTAYDAVLIAYSAGGVEQKVIRHATSGQDAVLKLGAAPTGGYSQIFAAGYSNNNMLVLRTSLTGVIDWSASINGTANGIDYGSDLVVETTGEVTVAGYTRETGRGLDATTVRLSKAGAELWRRSFNGAENGDDFLTAIALGPTGSVSVAGSTLQNPEDFDILYIQYSASGVQLGLSTYGLAGGDFTRDLVTDASGYSYLCGVSDGGATGDDIVVIKNSAGGRVWLKRLGVEGDDSAHRVELDKYNYLYVVASVASSDPDFEGQTDVLTLKMSSATGSYTEFLAAPGLAPDGGNVEAEDLAVSPNGDVFSLATLTYGGGDTDYAVAKYVQGGIPRADTYHVPANGSITVPIPGVKANDLYTDGTSAVLSAPPAYGTITGSGDGGFTYKPDPSKTGDIPFQYKLSKLSMLSAAAVVKLQVNPLPKSLIATSTSVYGGSTVPVTIATTGPAPTDGTVYSLSTDSSFLVPPSSVRVVSGASTATFNLGTRPVTASATRRVYASRSGVTVSLAITLLPGALQSISLSPSTVKGGTASTGTAMLNAPAGSGGRTVSLSDDSSAVIVPSSVTIASGNASATFAVSTSPVSANATRRVMGTLDGVTKTAFITLTP